MRKMKKSFIIILSTLLMPFISAWAEEYPKWITDWQDFAQNSGDRTIEDFVERMVDPHAVELGKNWADYMGFDAPSYVEKNDPAPDVKPGVVITSENYTEYPGLKKLLPPVFYELLKPGAYAGFGKMTIVPTFHYSPHAGRQKYAKEYEGTCKIVDGFNLANWKASYPFPKVNPKGDSLGAVKLMHNLNIALTGNDDWEEDPLTFFLFGRDNTLERTHNTKIYWKSFHGRTMNPPIHDTGTDYIEKLVVMATSPYDIAGFVGLKTRYKDPAKGDDLLSYIPSMRRIRRLSGSNTQDPVVGSDYSWDDWRGFWVNLSNKVFDLKAEFVGEEIRLLPAKAFPATWRGSKVDLYWEKRPFYVVDFFAGGHVYGRQRIWIDKEIFHLGYKLLYDQKGKLWKKYYPVHLWRPENGTYGWYTNVMIDVLNLHWSGMNFVPVWHEDALPDDLFNMSTLLRKAR